MPDQSRTTKERAQRINSGYIRKTPPLRKVRRWLTACLVAGGLIWLGLYALRGKLAAPYSAGPIRSSHASFGNNCARCHASEALFFKGTPNQACLACHDGPAHQAHVIARETPACGSCHEEHTGRIDLTRTNDFWCTQCHKNLATNNGEPPKVNAHITSFADHHHPEFAAVVQGSDPRTLKFNHKKHLREDLPTIQCTTCDAEKPRRARVQLQCSDCHRVSLADNSFQYGQKVQDPTPAPAANPHARQSARAYMAPVNFYEHCSKCHPLCYDPRFGLLPHRQQPEQVHAIVVQRYTDYINSHQEKIHDMTYYEQVARHPPPAPPRNNAEWVKLQTWAAETVLWKRQQGCALCHSFTLRPDPELPVKQQNNITAKWMPKANFDHEAHQMLKCESCHSHARTEEDSFKVLLPSIQVCERCHRPGDKSAANGGCFECHVYHNWSNEKRINGKFDIDRFSAVTRSPARVSTPAAIAAIPR